MYRFFNNLNIKSKLIATSVLCAVLVGGFIILFFPYNQKLQIREQALEKSLAIAEMTADNLAASVAFKDSTTAEEVLGILRGNHDLVFCIVRTVDGNEFVKVGQPHDIPGTTGSDSLIQARSLISGTTAITSVPIRNRGDVVGNLLLGLSMERVQAQMQRVTNTALIVGMLLALMIILFATVIANKISRPINQVIAASSLIARGNLRAVSHWFDQ